MKLGNIPREARYEIRLALFAAQNGETVKFAKRMHGELRDVTEIVAHDRAGTFRGIYYVGKEVIYARHFFQKKSKHGIGTPKKELDLIRRRLASAHRDEEKRG